MCGIIGSRAIKFIEQKPECELDQKPLVALCNTTQEDTSITNTTQSMTPADLLITKSTVKTFHSIVVSNYTLCFYYTLLHVYQNLAKSQNT